MITSNVDRVFDGHVGNHARFVTRAVVYFISCVSSGLLCVHLLPAFFWKCMFMILKFFDVAHSIGVSPLSFCWPRPKHPVPFVLYFLSSNFRIEVPHHNCVMCLFSQDIVNGVVDVEYLFIWVRCCWRIIIKLYFQAQPIDEIQYTSTEWYKIHTQ